MLTKKPISGSSSVRVRPAIGARHHQVVLGGVSMEQRLERRQQRHEQRRALMPAEGFQHLHERGRQMQLMVRTGERLGRRPRAIGRQVDGRQIA